MENGIAAIATNFINPFIDAPPIRGGANQITNAVLRTGSTMSGLLAVTPSGGAGTVNIGPDSAGGISWYSSAYMDFISGSAYVVRIGGTTPAQRAFTFPDYSYLAWISGNLGVGSVDVGLRRNAAGELAVDNGDGTGGTFRDLRARTLTGTNINFFGTATGNGSGLTNLTGANVTGTLPQSTYPVALTNSSPRSLTWLGDQFYSANLIIDGGHHLTLTNATASRVIFSDALHQVTNVAASGSVPLNADGTATTFAQLQALAPSVIQTNGANTAYSNNVSMTTVTEYFTTNSITGFIPDFAKFSSAATTNNVPMIQLPTGSVGGGKLEQIAKIYIYNTGSTVTNILVVGGGGQTVKTNGSWWVTNSGCTLVTYTQFGNQLTNAFAQPLY